MEKSLVFWASAFFACMAFADVTVVRNGNPSAVIALPKDASANEEFAAGQLRYWVKEISGADLPVEEGERAEKVGGTKIRIGRRMAEGKFDEDLKWLEGTEGFAVRESGGDLYLFGAKGCGNVFAGYDILEKNTDIIWPALEAGMDRVFTPVETLTVKTGYREKPAIAKRLFMHDHDARNFYFFLRNRAYSSWLDFQLKTAGCPEDDFACHNTWVYVPYEKLKDTHPEYFALVNGKRIKPGGFDGNLCFSSMECADEYAKNFIRERIENGLETGTYGIGAEDNNILCLCEKCRSPISLPDGKVLKIGDDEELFRSTQFFIWLNRIAEKVKKAHPEVKIATIAYMYATRPPAIRLCDNITVNYGPIGKNMKQDYFGPTNVKWKKYLDEWSERCKELSFFEYWGDGSQFPRPITKILARDIPYMIAHKTTRVNSEWGHGKGSQYVSAPEFWVACKLMWNPEIPLEEYRERYFRRAFRGGAADMRVFYDALRDAWYRDGSTSFYYDNPVRLCGYYFLGDEGLGSQCFHALSNAYAKADHPASKLLIGKIKETMEKNLAEARKTFVKGGSAVVPFVNDASLTTIEGGAWANALVLEGNRELVSMFKMKKALTVPVEVRVAHDRRNLYVKFHAGWKPEVFKATKKEMWSNEHWEMFLQSDRNDPAVPYYQFGLDPNGKQATNIGFAKAENPPEWSAMTRRGSDAWDAVCTFPFASLGIKPGIAPRLHFMHHAQLTPDECEWASWGSRGVHDAASFTEAKLGE